MVDGCHPRATITLALLLAILPAAAWAGEPAAALAWRAAVAAGAVVPIPLSDENTRGTADVTVGYSVHERVEVQAGLRYARSAVATEISAAAGAGLVFRPGPLDLVFGARLGYAAIHVPRGALWTGAFVARFFIEARVRFWKRWEIVAAPATFALCHNDFTILSWEPSLGLGVRF